MSQNKDMIKLLLLLNKSIVETFTLMNSVSRMHAHTHAHTHTTTLLLSAFASHSRVRARWGKDLPHLHSHHMAEVYSWRSACAPSQPLACAERYPGILTLKC